MGNFRSSTEKTPILWIWLRKRPFCKICWENTIPQIRCKKQKCFQVEENVLFSEEEKNALFCMWFSNDNSLYFWEIIVPAELFFNFFPIPLVLQSVSLSLTLYLSLFLCLSICCGKPGAQVVWTLFGFVSVTVSMARGMVLIRKHMKLTKFGKCTSFAKVPHPILSN